MSDPTKPPELPSDYVPPPLKAPRSATLSTFGRVLLIATGVGAGFGLGLLATVFAPLLFNVPMLMSGPQPKEALLTVAAFSFLAIVGIAVLIWRRGLRGLPLGLVIGASLGSLLVVSCAIG